MKNQNLPSFSISEDGTQEFNFKTPSSWAELSQEQLRYVLTVLSTYKEKIAVKCCLLTRFCGLQVIKHTRTGWKCSVLCVTRKSGSVQGDEGEIRPEIKTRVLYIGDGEILSLLKNFDFIDEFSDFQPLERVSDRLLVSVDRLLRDISFFDYLNIEKNYQLFMLQQEDRFLQKMAHLMYRTADGSTDETAIFEPYELLGVFMWFSSVKEYFALNFPNFFKPAKDGGELKPEDLLPAMQAQIRALTDGDITKLKAVYDAACWDALSELDAKAREAEEYRKQMKK